MTGAHVDANEYWGRSSLGVLQCGGELEAVGRENPVVVVAGGDQSRRIGRAGTDVVVGRICQQGFEILGVVRRAVIRSPGPADGPLVEAQHIQHAHRGDHRAKQVGALGQAGAGQQPAVGAAFDRQARGARIAVCDQPFARGDKVIKDVLLVVQFAGVVPGFAVLAPAAQVGLSKHPTHLHPHDLGWVKMGCHGDS